MMCNELFYKDNNIYCTQYSVIFQSRINNSMASGYLIYQFSLTLLKASEAINFF